MKRIAQFAARRRIAALAAAIVIGIAATAAFALRDDLVLGSRQSAVDGGAAADNDSLVKYMGPAISADGRYVAFESTADNLSSADDNTYKNVFVRDFETGTTILVSRQTDGDGGAGANGDALDASISADGRYVAFTSGADNLSADDNNTVNNIFVRDLQTGTTTLVSRQSAGDGGAGADGSSSFAAISPDGRFVAFQSDADNLSGADNSSFTNVFVRDVQGSTTTLVSRQSDSDGGAGADNGHSYDVSISQNGRFVAFDSEADNLSTADNNSVRNIFRRDLVANTTTLVSRAGTASGAAADKESDSTSISGDGRYVAFESSATNLLAGDTNGTDDIYVRDMETNTVMRASGGTGVLADWSYGPSISLDGRFVAFYGQADDLSDSDVNTVENVFVRDLQTGTLTLISREAGAAGAGGDDDSSQPSVSDNGAFVVFYSAANNLAADDNDTFTNVFRREVRSLPRNLAAPTISGTPETGQTLTCSPGTWTSSPTFAFQWNRDGATIPGATSATYAVTAADAGHQLSCTVTATTADGSASATSAAVTAKSPAGTSTNPLAVPQTPLPVLTVSGRVSTRAQGKATVVSTGIRVACPAQGQVACAVRVTSVSVIPKTVRAAKTTIGKRSFSVAAGGTTKVTFKLSKKAAKVLRRLKRLKTTITVVARRGTGSPVQKSRAATLKAPKRRK